MRKNGMVKESITFTAVAFGRLLALVDLNHFVGVRVEKKSDFCALTTWRAAAFLRDW